MTGDKTLTCPLTDEERELTERYHDLIWKVMNDMQLPRQLQDDLYGDGALALMAAVRQYQTQSKLQKHSFATIAYVCIKRACFNNIATEAAVSLDAEIGEGGLTLYEVTPAPDYTPENSEKTLKAYSRVKELLSGKEYMCAEIHTSGLPTREIKQYYGISHNTYNCVIRRARKKCFAHYGDIFDTTEAVEMPKEKHRPVTEEENAEILRLFNEGMSAIQIANILGRHRTVIYRHIKKFRQAAT